MPQMDCLALLQHARERPGHHDIAVHSQDQLLVPGAGPELPSLLPRFQHAVDKIAGVAAGCLGTKQVLS